MEIKGTSVKITKEFVKSKFPLEYEKWMKMLPPNSFKILNDTIKANEWYELTPSVIHPTQVMAKLFYKNDVKKASWELGNYSAKIALTGIYKMFLMVTSVKYVLDKARNVWGTYYRPCEFYLEESSQHRAVIRIEGFKIDGTIIFHRLGGWLDGLYELTKQDTKKIDISIQYKPQNFIVARIDTEWGKK